MAETDPDFNFLTNKIIGTTPRWIVRWGITIIILVLLLLGIILSMIKYPITNTSRATLQYLLKPIPLLATENCVIVQTFAAPSQDVSDGHRLLLVKGTDSKRQYEITAPANGRFFMTGDWRPQSYCRTGQPLGFVLPLPNERTVRLSVDKERGSQLTPGQSIQVNVNCLHDQPLKLDGKISFIDQSFNRSPSFVDIRLSSSTNSYLASIDALRTVDSIDCTATWSASTMTYLKYIFQRF